MSDVPHQQRTIKFDASLGKQRRIRKITGVNIRHIEGFDFPLFGFKRDSIEAVVLAGFRKANRERGAKSPRLEQADGLDNRTRFPGR